MALDPDALAHRQWQDYRRRQPGSYFGEGHPPLDLDAAYAVQAGVARLRSAAGDPVAGYKVGCIGPGTVAQFGMSGPILGRLFRSEFHADGARLRAGDYANLAIEGEMALRIGAGGAIESAFPVIELHHFVFRGPTKTLGELIANNGLQAGVVLPGPAAARPVDHWNAAESLAIRVNGRTIDQGALWAMPGGAAAAVAWLDAALRRQGLALAAGDLVLAGTPLGLHPVAPGDHVRVEIDGCKLIECRIDPSDGEAPPWGR